MLTGRAASAAHLRLADPPSARLTVLRAVQAVPAASKPVRECAGSVVARDVRAPRPLPPFDNSAMDGYALSVSTVSDGRTGRFAPICTGQPIPAWADAVVPLEYAVQDDGHLRLEIPVATGMHVRPAGEELAAGALAIAAGATLTPAAMGLLAALDVRTVSVHRMPRVALLISGDELRDPGDAVPEEAQVADANGPMLHALLTAAGAEITAVAHVADDPITVEEVLRDLAAGADLVITSGGASVGSRDHVVAGVQRIGELLIHQLAVRPGRPASFGAVSGTPVVLLPGNPLAALVGFEILARPAIRRLAGARDPFRIAVEMPLGDVASLPDRWLAIPVELTGRRGVRAARAVELAGSAMLTGAAAADGMALIPPAPGPATDRVATRTAMVELW